METLVAVGGLAYGGLRFWQSLSEGIETTKAKWVLSMCMRLDMSNRVHHSLKDKGYNVSSKGVAVKKNTQMVDRESYLDATQRYVCFVRLVYL